MYYFIFLAFIAIGNSKGSAQQLNKNDLVFRVEPGSKTCIYQHGKAGEEMEVYYQVLDGQHGDLDISLDILDPNGVKLMSDHKKSENSIIMELNVDGDYGFCLDNTYSMMNSKLVFVYVGMENKTKSENNVDGEVAVVSDDGDEQKEDEVLEWVGVDEEGDEYYLEVSQIADSISRTLKHILQARHLLDIYSASKSRDSYMAFEGTFFVDLWSGIQICFMFLVGMMQVYMIKQLFQRPCGYKSIY